MSAETQKKRIASLIATEWTRLVGYVRAWIADTAERDAEDVVQDVIERLFEKADVTEPVADLTAYLYRSLRNKVIDLYKDDGGAFPEAPIISGFHESMSILYCVLWGPVRTNWHVTN